MSRRDSTLKQTNIMEAMSKVFRPPSNTELENFRGGPVGCQNVTAQIQSLREERSSTGAQHINLLFKYLAGASTQVSKHEPRHMDAPQYRLNCPRHMHKLYIHVCTRGRILSGERQHLLGVERLHIQHARAH